MNLAAFLVGVLIGHFAFVAGQWTYRQLRRKPPAIGSVWYFDYADPFRPTKAVQVLDVREGWVQVACTHPGPKLDGTDTYSLRLFRDLYKPAPTNAPAPVRWTMPPRANGEPPPPPPPPPPRNLRYL